MPLKPGKASFVRLTPPNPNAFQQQMDSDYSFLPTANSWEIKIWLA